MLRLGHRNRTNCACIARASRSLLWRIKDNVDQVGFDGSAVPQQMLHESIIFRVTILLKRQGKKQLNGTTKRNQNGKSLEIAFVSRQNAADHRIVQWKHCHHLGVYRTPRGRYELWR
ncbi:hypothetical protein PILCRDRAFT_815027 [Piloderma croceum F 1598]|uniref:Uncharacterized protein n=1 Tax=Piloderma croceum (strain F 1598) TaxID=765440 RepID=A0A0C3CCU0_PILCF|nr:hypothetical protein PILCRDRAFT_815027 [Piloderma croceum F 1598]